jgi:alkylhydroperoxidase/carboxymuconolactone decarboxylase family protein YurZ
LEEIPAVRHGLRLALIESVQQLLKGAPMSQETDTPVLDLLTRMNTDAIETTTLDPEAAMLVRIAALVAVDAPPASYLLNLSVAGEVNVGVEEIQGVLAAIAPIVGSPRVAAASGNMMRALGLALDFAELESETT